MKKGIELHFLSGVYYEGSEGPRGIRGLEGDFSFRASFALRAKLVLRTLLALRASFIAADSLQPHSNPWILGPF